MSLIHGRMSSGDQVALAVDANGGLISGGLPPTSAPNPTTTFTRTDNTIVPANQITISKVIDGVTYTKVIKRNASLEVLQVMPWV